MKALEKEKSLRRVTTVKARAHIAKRHGKLRSKIQAAKVHKPDSYIQEVYGSHVKIMLDAEKPTQRSATATMSADSLSTAASTDTVDKSESKEEDGATITPTITTESDGAPEAVEQRKGLPKEQGEDLPQELRPQTVPIRLSVETSPEIMHNRKIICARILDSLERIFSSGRLLSCAQMGVLMGKSPIFTSSSIHHLTKVLTHECPISPFFLDVIPYGSTRINEFGTYRVELVVRLFSRILDIINFDIIVEKVNNQEHAMLIFRLGYLNTWNPLKVHHRHSSITLPCLCVLILG
jgi:hypothetical protein